MCVLVGGLLRLALAVAAVLGVAAGACELGLRAAGAGPRAAADLSRIVPDGWTGFRLRPGLSGGEAFVTNDLGMHAPRSYTLERPPGSLRVAVLGSSVVYGLATGFTDTIPGVVERELQAAGHRAEVLNFGTHAFTIVNLSALLQAYVHQFEPNVVVVVVDLQVGLPDWPDVRPGASSDERIESALAHGGWAPPSLGFLFGAAILVLVDFVRVPLLAPSPAQAAGWRGWAWVGRGALWAAAGVAMASVTHLLWGAAEKAFIYFRF